MKVNNEFYYYCLVTDKKYNNMVWPFYDQMQCLLHAYLIGIKYIHNKINIFGDILRLELEKSVDMFDLLETRRTSLVDWCFGNILDIPSKTEENTIKISIEIDLDQLVPSIWEKKLYWCADYGNTFSNILGMVLGADVMHGEDMNVDDFWWKVLSHLWVYTSANLLRIVLIWMKIMRLPRGETNCNIQIKGLNWEVRGEEGGWMMR